jgi:AcrR family transcriptional regulator
VRAAILDAAEELIAARGLGVSLIRIAKRAGLAVGTLYNYFADRDALIKALFESRRGTLRPLLRAAQTNGAELAFEPRLRQFVRDVFAAFELHRRFLKVAIETEHIRLTPSTTAEDIRHAFAEIIAAGVNERVVSKVQAELLPLLLAGSLRALVLSRLADGSEFVGEADAFVTIFLEGARGRR